MPDTRIDDARPATEAGAPSPLVDPGGDGRTISPAAAELIEPARRPQAAQRWQTRQGNLRALMSMRDFRVFLTGEAISAIGDAVTLSDAAPGATSAREAVTPSLADRHPLQKRKTSRSGPKHRSSFSRIVRVHRVLVVMPLKRQCLWSANASVARWNSYWSARSRAGA